MKNKQSESENQTYTHAQVEDLMWRAISQYDAYVTEAMQGLEDDKEFKKEAIKNNYTPVNWLYYAQDDITYRKGISVDGAWADFTEQEELTSAGQWLVDLLPPGRKADLIEKGIEHADVKTFKLKQMFKRLNDRGANK